MISRTFPSILGFSAGVILLTYLSQLSADSFHFDWLKLLPRLFLSAVAYGTVFFRLSRPGTTRPEWQKMLGLAIIGGFLDIVLISIYEGYQDYMVDTANQVWESSSFFASELKQLALRLVVLLPLKGFAFCIIFISFYLLFKLIERLVTQSAHSR